MHLNLKRNNQNNSGITLIALVITIIVMLILVSVTISMAVNGGLFEYAGNAAKETKTEIEREKNLSIDNLVAQYVPKEPDPTFGGNYEDSWIGRTINYHSSNNNVNDWIIIGKQVNQQGKNDIIITTKNPVGSLYIDGSLANYIRYCTLVNNACSNYVGTTGTLGTKAATIKEVRSLTLEDINNAVGFTPPETLIEYTFRPGENDLENHEVNYWFPNDDENNPAWVEPTVSNTYTHLDDAYSYFYNSNTEKWVYRHNKIDWEALDVIELTSNNLKAPNNFKYIFADKSYHYAYYIASTALHIESDYCKWTCFAVNKSGINPELLYYLCSSGGSGGGTDRGEDGGIGSDKIRPVVVLSSEIPWEDVESLIGDYATYD